MKMSKIFFAFGMVAILATSASALTNTQRCDKAKSLASGKEFYSCMKCQTTEFGNPAFDEDACRNKAYSKCYTAFARSDLLYAGSCLSPGNGPGICSDTISSCDSIWSSIRPE